MQATNFSKLTVNLLLNVLLSPVYVAFFVLTTILALTPLFPARIARANLRQRTQAGRMLSFLGTSAVLFHYVLVVLEDFVFWPLGGLIVRDNPKVRNELTDASLHAQQSGRGIALLSAHFGNIEVCADSAALTLVAQIDEDRPIIALAKPSRFAYATKILNWYRAQRKIEVILTNRKDLVRAMMHSLKQGRVLALLVDQKPAHAGYFVDFFGTPAAFPEGGLEVALRTNAEFVCLASRRLWPGCYTFEGCWLREHIRAQQPLDALLKAYARWLELVVLKSPWQWCWDYKKWSRRPTAPTSPTT
jgi:lauroyl/myristoyl acyltransferase